MMRHEIKITCNPYVSADKLDAVLNEMGNRVRRINMFERNGDDDNAFYDSMYYLGMNWTLKKLGLIEETDIDWSEEVE